MLVHERKSKKNQELEVGEVVLIEDDDTKRIRWPLGVLVAMFMGKTVSPQWLGLLMVYLKDLSNESIHRSHEH